jgi:signal transduction histidine kinase
MRRAACIFLAAILLPCLVLAWLAVRSEQDQQVILQHQQAIIDQGVADSLAQNVRSQMDGVIADFVHTTQNLLATAGTPAELADGFHHRIREAWPLAQVGFAVDLHGVIYAPQRSDGIQAQTFRKENGSFLSNREDAEVYSNVQNQMEPIVPDTDAMTAHSSLAEDASATNSAILASPQAASTPSTTPARVTSAEPGNLKAMAPPALTSSSATAAVAGDLITSKLESPAADEAAASASRDSIEQQQSRTTDSLAVSDALRANVARNLPPSSHPSTEDSATPAAAVPTAPASPASAFTASPASSDIQESHSAVRVTTTTTAGAPSASPSAFAFQNQQLARIERQVAPQENARAPGAELSNVLPAQSDFRQLIGQSTSGSVARFLEDRLCLLVWSLPARSSIVFGAQLDQDKLVARLLPLVRPEANRSSLDSSYGARTDYCLALIDDKGHPVALSQANFTADWKHPFVATEIGSVLPHWEAALYLTNPGQVSHSARVLHFTIGLIILVLIVAILAGGTLIGADVGRQMRLAQQKTDFVSNVSHELKTPLTSIRMFADMLAEGRVEEPDKQATYLRIISAESARLTRLINNVLDFARLERGAPAGERHPCDLVEVVRDVAGICQPHLESAGVTLELEIEAESLPMLGDRDAVSQIILNLISNAEKYGGGEIMVRVRRQETPAGPMGCVDVLDRGLGIPPKEVDTVFAPFKRLDDSLASGVPGSGLGLTLARRMSRAHGGDVTYQSRPGGGSCFTLALPLSPKKSSA